MSHWSASRALLAVTSTIVVIAACQPVSTGQAGAAPEVIYHGGIVYTGIAGEDLQEAVAVTGGRITEVGKTADILGSAREQTRIVELAGNMMLPGLNDNHVHADTGGDQLMEWKGGLIFGVPEWLREATTITELQEAIRREAARLGPGEWLVGALNREIWPNQMLPTRADLDAGTTANPVLLTRGPHTTVLNSMALDAAGIDRTTTFPGGGHIGHDADGEPNGRLYDSARRLGRHGDSE